MWNARVHEGQNLSIRVNKIKKWLSGRIQYNQYCLFLIKDIIAN